MLSFLDKKSKRVLGVIGLLGLGAIAAKGIYDYSMYKIMKDIERSFKKNSWDYYE